MRTLSARLDDEIYQKLLEIKKATKLSTNLLINLGLKQLFDSGVVQIELGTPKKEPEIPAKGDSYDDDDDYTDEELAAMG